MTGSLPPSKRPPPRLQFRLRTLLLVNVTLACGMAAFRTLIVERGTASIAVAPTVWLLGAFGVVTMAALGDAMGRDRGAIVGAGLAGAIWSLVFVLMMRMESGGAQFRPSWFVHGAAIVGTVAGVCLSAVRRLREDGHNEFGDQCAKTTQHLLDGQKERRGEDRLPVD